MGDGNMELLAALKERDELRIVQARHENAAVAMADGGREPPVVCGRAP